MKLLNPKNPLFLLVIWLILFAIYCVYGSPVYGQGLVANSRDAAAENLRFINEAFAASPPRTVTLPSSGRVYIDDVIRTRNVVGCGRFKCDGSFGYGGVPCDHPTIGGSMVEIVQLGKCPHLRLSGAGFVCTDPIRWVGAGTQSGIPIIEVEGRSSVATGRHRFRDQCFDNADCAFKALAGYYAPTQNSKPEYSILPTIFVPDENHADNCIVDGCEFMDLRAVFVSENQQAVGWKFNDPVVNQTRAVDCVFADLARGGSVFINRLVGNVSTLTVFRVRDFSPNNCALVCRDLWRDRPDPSIVPDGGYLTIFDYAGKPADRWTVQKWLDCLEVTGFVPVHFIRFDRSQLYRHAPAGATAPRVRITFSGEPLK